MKRENFLERATFSTSGHSHTFKPLTQGVSPELYEVSLVATEAVTVDLEFQDVLDDGDTTLFKHSFAVKSGATLDNSFQTHHQPCFCDI